jgi:hypothetical protein
VRSYVLRYAGVLDQAVRDCDTALVLDPHNPVLRSCGFTNSLAGRHDRALQFVALGEETEFGRVNRAVILMRQGESEQAAELSRQLSLMAFRAFEAQLDDRPLEQDTLQQIVATTLAKSDPEKQYWDGSILAHAGEHEAGLRLIREGIGRGYCSYPFMDSDPLLAGHEQFLAETGAG